MADTLRALDAAVQAHIAENFPGAVTDSDAWDFAGEDDD